MAKRFIVVLEVEGNEITKEHVHEAMCKMFHEGMAIHDTQLEGIVPGDVPDWVNDVIDVVEVENR